jgi:tRNA(adenine34) deaminase
MTFDFDALNHDYFMREALKEAELAGLAGEKPIGAVIVHERQVIGRGRAQHRARQSEIAHAEMNALLQAEQFIQAHVHDGCVIYTTVEPCVMCLGRS